MNYNKRIFSKDKKSNEKIKSFVIAFSVFIVILSVCSIVLFMYSLDFDINNLVEITTVPEETTNEPVSEAYSVDSLTGKSNIMFVILDDNDEVESAFCTSIDFNSKSFKVKQVNSDARLSYGNSYKSVHSIYKESGEEGLKNMFSDRWGIETDKYAVFKSANLKKFLSSFNGITVNVTEKVDFKSSEFSLELDTGKQELSSEKALNYLKICNNKEQVLCDIISSLLKPEYADKADKLFKLFANSSKTDISVIDFSDSFETLKTYCYAEDKFLPIPYTDGE